MHRHDKKKSDAASIPVLGSKGGDERYRGGFFVIVGLGPYRLLCNN